MLRTKIKQFENLHKNCYFMIISENAVIDEFRSFPTIKDLFLPDFSSWNKSLHLVENMRVLYPFLEDEDVSFFRTDIYRFLALKSMILIKENKSDLETQILLHLPEKLQLLKQEAKPKKKSKLPWEKVKSKVIKTKIKKEESEMDLLLKEFFDVALKDDREIFRFKSDDYSASISNKDSLTKDNNTNLFRRYARLLIE